MKTGDRVRTAVIGCGAISEIYLENMINRFQILEVAGCCDLNRELAKAAGCRHGIPVLTMDEILGDESIEMVVNLTPPKVHYKVIHELLSAGKHVYTEKVLASEWNQAGELVELAEKKGLYLGAAPDTFLGAAAQTGRLLVDSGIIGEVTSCYGVLNRDCGVMAERFPYTAGQGGGIGLDVGIYYVTLLLSILGPVREVSGISMTRKQDRVHTFVSGDKLGEGYRMESENLMAGTLEFECGCVGTLHFNANCIQNEKPQVVLYGTQGILYLPDPNQFGGEVKVLLKGQTEPVLIPHTHGYDGNSRGLGAAEMAWSIRRSRPCRADMYMACHGLEVLTGIMEAGRRKEYYRMESSFEKPSGLPRGYLGERYSGSEEESGLYF